MIQQCESHHCRAQSCPHTTVFGSNEDFWTISHLFDISKASVSFIKKDVCKTIVKLLLPTISLFPMVQD